MRRKISQAEAHRAIRELERLRRDIALQRCRWSSDYPGGVHLGDAVWQRDWLAGRVEAATMLGRAVVAKPSDEGLRLYAVPQVSP